MVANYIRWQRDLIGSDDERAEAITLALPDDMHACIHRSESLLLPRGRLSCTRGHVAGQLGLQIEHGVWEGVRQLAKHEASVKSRTMTVVVGTGITMACGVTEGARCAALWWFTQQV